MSWRTRFSVLAAVCLFLASSASAAILVSTTLPGQSIGPDMYRLSDRARFEGTFFSPFPVGDLAWDGSALLIGSESTGMIARTDQRGGLLSLIYTPATSILGLAVDSQGNLYVAEGGSNRLFKLDSAGRLLDIRFMPQQIRALGITASDDLIFTRPSGSSSRTPFDVVFWDFDTGEVSNFASTYVRVSGITALGADVLLSGSTTNDGDETSLGLFSSTGTFIEELGGPAHVRSITSHAPEPGTALLMGLGLAGLGRVGGRRRGETRSHPTLP